MKILFLDIDGVLNSLRSSRAFGGYPCCFDPECMARFDMVAIALVRRLCQETGAKIVLSSSWRIYHNAARVSAALDLPVIDETPDHGCYDTRGLEINAWLAKHPEVEHYAIVDDQAVMLPAQAPHFVQTDERHGLMLADFAQLKTILTDSDWAIL